MIDLSVIEMNETISVWKGSGRCIEGSWKVSGKCKEDVTFTYRKVKNFPINNSSLDIIWREAGRCLRAVWKVSATGQIGADQLILDRS